MSEDPPPAGPPDMPGPAGAAPGPILNYQGPRSGKVVTVAWCADAVEAELLCNELNADGIPAVTANENIVSALQGYVGFVRVEVRVAVEDVDRAAAVLARLPGRNDVEPEEEPADGSADFATDEGGGRVPLGLVAEFDTAQEMLEAAATLGAGRVRTFVPDLVPRRADAGEGRARKFKVRVLAEDTERARRVLERDAGGDEEEGDDPRCPKCASWRVHGTSPGIIQSLRRLLAGGGPRQGKTWECLRCGLKWGGAARGS